MDRLCRSIFFLLASLVTETFSWMSTYIHPGIFLRWTLRADDVSADEQYRIMWSYKTNKKV